jgi:hypothetical protein
MSMVWAQHERLFEPQLFVGGSLSTQTPSLKSHTTKEATVLPWLGAALDVGAAFEHNDQWGVALQGSPAVHGYLLWMDSVCFDVYSFTPRVEARLWRQIPLDTWFGDRLRIGCGFGYSFRFGNERESTEETFTVTHTSFPGSFAFIAPEIALVNIDAPDRTEFAVRYFRHLDRSPAWSNTSESPGGSATFTGTNDNVAVVFRYYFGFPAPELPRIPMPEINFNDRASDTLTTLHTHRARVNLVLWDNAEYDGDTITVLLNGVPVLSGHELTKRKKRVSLDLDLGDNTLLVIAHNEGRVPPNTASCIVRTGNGTTHMLLHTSRKANQTVVLRRE